MAYEILVVGNSDRAVQTVADAMAAAGSFSRRTEQFSIDATFEQERSTDLEASARCIFKLDFPSAPAEPTERASGTFALDVLESRQQEPFQGVLMDSPSESIRFILCPDELDATQISMLAVRIKAIVYAYMEGASETPMGWLFGLAMTTVGTPFGGSASPEWVKVQLRNGENGGDLVCRIAEGLRSTWKT